ncbi:Acg family FMN-binding oxidoreductase [Nocardia sp. NBC_01009]|uniref:Acg family FMN-binding oxidoreductase n=1 Tax=Nocardia sp. NBC_01009 TaxID=2975996 RepID=UPI003870493C|nr:hypothetical protein OHA42_25315 [Nocardia sp. NBC_01009]
MLAAIRLAGRAPSVHNTQPWRWVFDGTRLHLYGDIDRCLTSADPNARQLVISCGAALHHARTAFAAHGWHTDTVRMPDPAQPWHLAAIDFRPWPDPPAGIAERARAIDHRYTDRLPMLEPDGFARILPELRMLTSPHDIELDVLDDDARQRVAAASDHSSATRQYDMMYQTELQWWAGHHDMPEGVPPNALPSDAESAHVDVARTFPSVPHSTRRAALDDRSRLVVLSSASESKPAWLHTGEALSAVLLACTAAGLATCALTHITELPTGRTTIAGFLPHPALPQVVIRVGTSPDDTEPPPTPRRPVADVYTEPRT